MTISPASSVHKVSLTQMPRHKYTTSVSELWETFKRQHHDYHFVQSGLVATALQTSVQCKCDLIYQFHILTFKMTDVGDSTVRSVQQNVFRTSGCCVISHLELNNATSTYGLLLYLCRYGYLNLFNILCHTVRYKS